jgi:hypothetical protein
MVSMRFVALTLVALLYGRSMLAQGVDRVSVPEAYYLEISMPGAAVVRDSAAWATLWHRFGRTSFVGPKTLFPLPRVDFSRYMLVIVAGGPGSGCGNWTQYVQRILVRRDAVLVDLRAEPTLEPVITCMMWVNHIDVVRIPRTSKPVVFLTHRAGRFPPARWWDPPDLASLARAKEDERGFFLQAWARDPLTPPGIAVSIARMPPSWISGIAEDLLKRPEVRADPLAVASLAVLGGDEGADARRLLLDRHATALLRDPRTQRSAFGALITELAERAAKPEATALALARHPRIQGDRELFLRLIRATRGLDGVRAYACGVYVRKYPSRRRWSDTAKRGPDRWSHVIGCENLPR